ncbi:MAG TPA: flagellar hook-basal body complex protein FliE [Arthrobacter sp.]
MTIPAIAPVTGVTGTGYIAPVQGPAATDGSAFGASLTGAVDNLQSLQSTSKSLAVQAVTGNLTDIHTATLAATRAQVTLELVSAIRNKGVDGFNEIMRMQA